MINYKQSLKALLPFKDRTVRGWLPPRADRRPSRRKEGTEGLALLCILTWMVVVTWFSFLRLVKLYTYLFFILLCMYIILHNLKNRFKGVILVLTAITAHLNFLFPGQTSSVPSMNSI